MEIKPPEELRAVLAAGPRPGVVFLPAFHLDDVPRRVEEQGVVPFDLIQARQADLAMQVMSLANGDSRWGTWRYLVLGVSAEGEVIGLLPDTLDNDRLQEIIRRYCKPEPSCYYQEGRAERKRVGMIVIADSPWKPHRFAQDVTYEQAGRRQWAYHRGEIWVRSDGEPEVATPEMIQKIQLDAALVTLPAISQERVSPLPAREGQVDPIVLAELREEESSQREPPEAEDGQRTFPAEAERLVRLGKEYRLLILCGVPGVGKATLARYLAYRLAEELGDRPVFAASANTDTARLLAALCRARKSILLIYDAVPIQWQKALPLLQESAREYDNFLVLTSPLAKTEWAIPSVLQTTLVDFEEGYPYTSEELAEILLGYIQRHENQLRAQGYFLDVERPNAETALAGRKLSWIARQLGTPGAARRFAVLASHSYLADEHSLAQAISAASDHRQQLLDWFWELSDSERYFVLAVCLFGNLPRSEFWRWYERAVAEAWRTHDPLLRIIPGLNAALRRYVGEELRLDPTDRQLILAEAVTCYPRPLVWALPLVQETVNESAASNTEVARETRAVLAQVVGEVANRETAAALPTLRAWAVHRAEPVRLAAAHAISVAIQGQQGGGSNAMLSLLEDWARDQAVETGWVPPRYAHRVPWTVAWALGKAVWSLSEIQVEEILPLFWDLARNPDPRVRQALASALGSAGPQNLIPLAGLIGYLAADASKRVRSRLALSLATLAAAYEATILDLVRAWAEAEDGQRRWTALAALILMGRDSHRAADSLVALAARAPEWQEETRGVLAEICQAPSGQDHPLLPLLAHLAEREETEAKALAVAGLVAVARRAHRMPKVESWIAAWRASSSADLQDAAAQWDTEWAKLRKEEGEALMQAETEPEPAIEKEEEIGEAVAPPRVGPTGLPVGQEQAVAKPGPRRWVRRVGLGALEQRTRREAFLAVLHKLAVAAGLALLAYVVLRRFPYYDKQWQPVVLLAILALGYIRPVPGTMLAAVACALPLLYHSPALAISLFAFAVLFFLLAKGLGDSHRLEKTLVVFGFPLLALSPPTLAWPFVIGLIFRRRAAWLVLWGAILTMVIGIVLGQSLVGAHFGLGIQPERSLIWDRLPPDRWQTLDWLLDLEAYRLGFMGLAEVVRQLYEAFVTTPFPLVQVAFWCLLAWGVGWASRQPDRIAGIAVIGGLGLLAVALYGFLLTDVLGWTLPFAPSAALNAQILAGCAIALMALYGWPSLKRALRNARLGPRLGDWRRRAKGWLTSLRLSKRERSPSA